MLMGLSTMIVLKTGLSKVLGGISVFQLLRRIIISSLGLVEASNGLGGFGHGGGLA